MKAIRMYETGEPEVLQLEEVAIPIPKEQEILIKVAAAGINYGDLMQRQGMYGSLSPLPTTLGIEVAGTVMALGPGVTTPAKGTRVAAIVSGGYAEYALAHVSAIIPLPDTLDFVHAAALPVQGLTAYQTLCEAGYLQAGESVLVHAAAGGVGTLAVQIARLKGAKTVIGTASNETKLAHIRHLGADAAVNYTQADWIEQVKAATDGKGVDLILEMVGGKIAEQSLHCLAPFGRMVVIGAASGNITQFPGLPLIYQNQAIIGYGLLTWMQQRPERMLVAVQELMQLLASGQLHLIAGQTFPLAQAAEAHHAMAERKTIGKSILLMESME